MLHKRRLRPRDKKQNGPGQDSEPPFPCLSQKSTLIKLSNIRAAEKVEEKSFGSSHIMQVIYTDDAGRPQTAYLQCKVWAIWRGAEGKSAVEIVQVDWRESPTPSSATSGKAVQRMHVWGGLCLSCTLGTWWAMSMSSHRPAGHLHIDLCVVQCVDGNVP